MKTKKTKSVKKAKPVESLYKGTLIIFGKKYVAEAPTISEVLSKFQLGNSKGRSIIVMEKGDWKKERILQPIQTYKLFSGHGMMKDIAIKRITLLF